MKIDKQILLKKYFPQALTSLKEIITIPSFAQSPQENAPYGIGAKKVLDYAIDLAQDLGFETYQDPKNRFGFLDYGTGNQTFAILCHLDVVPPGNLDKWVTNPFQPIEKDGKLIGRGSFDDKGPTVMNLYALKYLKDQGFEPDYKIRLIFGLTEETTWESIHAYVDTFGPADLGYTPDAEFPVVYAEKWVADVDYTSSRNLDFELVGGQAYNMVDDMVVYHGPYLIQAKKILDEAHIQSEMKNETLVIYGKSGHGSLPFLGVNAATWAAYALKQAGLNDPIIDFLNEMHLNFDGTNFLPDLTDETGGLTQNVGIVEIRSGQQKIAVNYRVPVFSDVEKDVVQPMTTIAKKYDLETKVFKIEDSVYMPKDSDLVQKMLSVYQDVTGELDAEPLAIGGGTFAKAMPNILAFGAEFNIAESTMHAYNESVKIDELKKMLLIYAEALTLLTKN